jgi:Holliday junction resolvase RusA-like endonuclease
MYIKMDWQVLGDVPSLKNMNRFANGRCYHPKEIKEYKDSFALQTPKIYKKLYRDDICVTIKYWTKDLRKDVHNMEAICFDSLEYSGVIKNDRQIKLWGGKFMGVDKKNPRIEISLIAIDR